MLRALARRRSLVAVTVIAVALAAFAVPMLDAIDGHCPGGSDSHCAFALLPRAVLPAAGGVGLLESPTRTLSAPGAIRLVFKIPLQHA